MSAPDPIQPRRRELEIIKVLFDRHLADRAVSLAESRWPGSGHMVRLAYEWADLSPEERRTRISSIGPDDLARLRELAALNPELEQVVANLDERGVLPHLEEAALAGAAATATAFAPETEVVPETDLESGARQEPLEPAAERVGSEPTVPSVEEMIAESGIDLEGFDIEELNLEMPHLETDMLTTAEFLSDQDTRRQQAVENATEALERVRARLGQTTGRLLARPSSTSLSPPRYADFAPLPALAELPNIDDVSARRPQEMELDRISDALRVTEAPAWLVDSFAHNVVATAPADRRAPTDDELVALANDLGVQLADFTLEPGRTKEVYGGLARSGSRIDAYAGPLPTALAKGSLVVLRGRLYPRLEERLKAGFCDIPGTRATVKVHPDSRVLVIPG